MDFLEESKKLQTSMSIGKINMLLLSLEETEKQSLIDALNDLTISSRTISKILMSNGHKIGRSSVDMWRHQNVPNYHTRSNHYMGETK